MVLLYSEKFFMKSGNKAEMSYNAHKHYFIHVTHPTLHVSLHLPPSFPPSVHLSLFLSPSSFIRPPYVLNYLHILIIYVPFFPLHFLRFFSFPLTPLHHAITHFHLHHPLNKHEWRQLKTKDGGTLPGTTGNLGHRSLVR